MNENGCIMQPFFCGSMSVCQQHAAHEINKNNSYQRKLHQRLGSSKHRYGSHIIW